MKSKLAGELLLSTAMAGICTCSGCAPGPVVPQSTTPVQRAHIRGRNPFSLAEGATIVAIDGQSLVFTDSMEIAPGPHVVRICLEGALSSYQKCGDLRFVAEGGHSYTARGTSSGFLKSRDYLWIEDSRTGKMIAGERPL